MTDFPTYLEDYLVEFLLTDTYGIMAMGLLLYELFFIVKCLLLCLTLDLMIFVIDATMLK
jgi:hypothetical protein